MLELVEALESSGGYTQDEITERAAKFREKLVKVSKYMLLSA